MLRILLKTGEWHLYLPRLPLSIYPPGMKAKEGVGRVRPEKREIVVR